VSDSSIARVVRPDILALKAYPVVPAAPGMVKIDLMENPYRLPPELREALGQALAEVAINRYPVPSFSELTAELRAVLGIDPALGILLGNGSDDLLAMLTLLVARPEACVLALEPSFPMYRMNALLHGMRYVGVPLEADFTLDLDRLLAAIREHQPALVWLAYPNNPTGNLFPRAAMEAAIAAAPGLVVVDEAYFPFSGGATLLDAVPGCPQLVLVRTLSKMGLAGVRLGFAVAAPALIGELNKVRQPFNVNVLTEAAVRFILRHFAVLTAQTAALVANRPVLERGLDALPQVTRFPSAANFVTIRVPDAPRTYAALRERGILVRNFHGGHPLLDHCLRVTVGTAEEIAQLLAALPDCL
jgi:histidinol-phosphate aminotransferase